jgi:hypothetical protein
LPLFLEVAFSPIVGVELGPGKCGTLGFAGTILEALIVGASSNDL